MSLILEHVTHIYNKGMKASESCALDDINLTINDGEFIGIIGHTGSGKSTLIQHFNALLKPDSGVIRYDGVDIYSKGYDIKKLRSEVGLVFQYPEHQLFEADIFSDVCFGPKNLGLSAEKIEDRAKTALAQVGIPEKLFKQSPFELSGGQKRRVAIAGVLAMQPKVLILDEPAAGLDPRGRIEILDLVKDLHKNMGLTIILVSHSMEDVAEYVNRIIVMDKSKIFMDAAPKEVFSHSKELIDIGLDIPFSTKLCSSLKSFGWDIKTDIITRDEAIKEVLRCLK